MTYSSEQATIRKHFLQNWDSLTTPVMFGGEPGLTAGGRSIRDEKGLKQWVRLTINSSGASQRDLAGPDSRVRYDGVININVFVLASSGASSRARMLLDQLNDIFLLKTVENITFRPPENGLTAETEGLLQMTLNIPFFWYNF